MYKMVGMFFEEVWLHRHNKFIAVGGAAAFAFFVAYALRQLPWVPETVKAAAMITSMSLIGVTLLMMVYYVLKFIWLGLRWSYRKVTLRPSGYNSGPSANGNEP